MRREEELRRRRAEIAAYPVAARLDLEIARHLADQVPEFVGRARQDHAQGSNVGCSPR